jgi:hypothetical protein
MPDQLYEKCLEALNSQQLKWESISAGQLCSPSSAAEEEIGMISLDSSILLQPALQSSLTQLGFFRAHSPEIRGDSVVVGWLVMRSITWSKKNNPSTYLHQYKRARTTRLMEMNREREKSEGCENFEPEFLQLPFPAKRMYLLLYSYLGHMKSSIRQSQ